MAMSMFLNQEPRMSEEDELEDDELDCFDDQPGNYDQLMVGDEGFGGFEAPDGEPAKEDLTEASDVVVHSEVHVDRQSLHSATSKQIIRDSKVRFPNLCGMNVVLFVLLVLLV